MDPVHQRVWSLCSSSKVSPLCFFLTGGHVLAMVGGLMSSKTLYFGSSFKRKRIHQQPSGAFAFAFIFFYRLTGCNYKIPRNFPKIIVVRTSISVAFPSVPGSSAVRLRPYRSEDLMGASVFPQDRPQTAEEDQGDGGERPAGVRRSPAPQCSADGGAAASQHPQGPGLPEE